MDLSSQLFAAVDLNDPSGSEVECRRLLASLPEENSDNSTSVNKAQILTQLARTLGLQKRFTEATDVLQEAKNTLDASTATQVACEGSDVNVILQQNILQIRYLLEHGRILNSSGSGSDSVPYFKAAADKATQALQEHKSHPEHGQLQYLAVDALHMLAIVAPAAGERNRFAEQAVKLAESSADKLTHQWLGPLYNNLAWDRMDEGEFTEAIVLFRKAVVIRKETLDSSPAVGKEREKAFIPWKIACWSVGHALMQSGQDKDAVKELENLLGVEADGPNIREDLATLYERRGDKVAAVHAKKALELGVDGEAANRMREVIRRFS